MFDCDVWVPAELSSTKQGENFFWAGTNAATGDQNFVITLSRTEIKYIYQGIFCADA